MVQIHPRGLLCKRAKQSVLRVITPVWRQCHITMTTSPFRVTYHLLASYHRQSAYHSRNACIHPLHKWKIPKCTKGVKYNPEHTLLGRYRTWVRYHVRKYFHQVWTNPVTTSKVWEWTIF